MNFLSIEYFTAVAAERSFSKAAKRLGITQQTLSANVAALERHRRFHPLRTRGHGRHDRHDAIVPDPHGCL